MNRTEKFHTSARAVVENYIYACGLHGATDEEISKALRMRSNTSRPRRIELAKLEAIYTRGTRPTDSGGVARVWVHSKFGIAA